MKLGNVDKEAPHYCSLLINQELLWCTSLRRVVLDLRKAGQETAATNGFECGKMVKSVDR